MLGAAAAAGAVYEAAIVIPAARGLPAAANGVDFMRTLRLHPRSRSYRYLALAGAGAIVAAVVLVAFWHHHSQAVAWLTALGLAFFLAAAFMNAVYWSYLGRHVHGWGHKAGWTKDVAVEDGVLLHRLAGRNLIRAAFYGAGFTAFAVAASVA